jgi:ribosome maturation factor RimP
VCVQARKVLGAPILVRLELSDRRPRAALEVGFAAHLFFDRIRVTNTTANRIQPEIEARLASAEPDVEVLACQQAGSELLRVVIDHPRGVDLALCERVTGHLRDLLTDHALEVSSPGPRRPLTKPDHFRRFIGRRAKVRTGVEHGGRQSFTGELVGASEEEVTMAAESGVVSIPYTEISRSNLVEE